MTPEQAEAMRAFKEIGGRRRAEVVRCSNRGERHPDPAIAAIADRWAAAKLATARFPQSVLVAGLVVIGVGLVLGIALVIGGTGRVFGVGLLVIALVGLGAGLGELNARAAARDVLALRQ